MFVAEAPAERAYLPRRYYVLTNAGKPVFSLYVLTWAIGQAYAEITTKIT